MRLLVLFALAAATACAPPSSTLTLSPRASVRSTDTPRAPTATAIGVVRYVAIGASDTVGVGATDPVTGSWPARVATQLPTGSAFVNVGVSGSTAPQAREQQLPRAIAQKPSVVSIWLAVNDMNAQIAPDAYHDALAAIVDGLAARTDAKVFVGNVPDIRGVPAYKDADKTLLFQQITAYNEAVASVVRAYRGRAFAVDLFTGSAPLVSTLTVSEDGFHPSDEGYRLIAERFAKTMRDQGIPLRAG